MKFTFTSTTMPCAMVLVVALLPGNSASLKPVGGSKNATAGADDIMMLSNATMMDPNMTAADKLSNKMHTNEKKLGSGSVSVSTVVGAPARADPLSLFAYFMLCLFCGVSCCANIIAHTHSHHTSALCPPSPSADERRR